LTKLTDTTRTIMRPADAGNLAIAARSTINALIQRGHDDHAARIKRDMSDFLRGSIVVHVETLRHWEELFEVAGDLLAADDTHLAYQTAQQAGYRAYCERQAFEKDAKFVGTAPPVTYDNLNARLSDAYEIIASLPKLADPDLDARVQQVAELIDQLTYDTFDDHLDEAGVDGSASVETTVLGVAA